MPNDLKTSGEKPQGKRARTRIQLLDAAARMYSRLEVGDLSLVGLAEEAQVANGTVYNYFRSREEVLEATAESLADRFSDSIAVGYSQVTNGAERMAIGQRWFVRYAEENITWASAVSRVVVSARSMKSMLAEYIRKDLRLGKKQGHFTYQDEEVALELCLAVPLAGVRLVVGGSQIKDHAEKSAEMVLLALGVSSEEAHRYARLPLPTLGGAVVATSKAAGTKVRKGS